MLDKAERDLFILLQAAVKTSHEKEKIHTNSAKYWSIVGSLAGTVHNRKKILYKRNLVSVKCLDYKHRRSISFSK